MSEIARVRQRIQTAIIWDRKYQNIDTGKYDLDKMEKLSSLSWSDIVDTECELQAPYKPYRPYKANNVTFVPKDNDFEEECRRDDEIKRKEQELAVLAKEAKVLDFDDIVALTKSELRRAGWVGVPDHEISKFVAQRLPNSWRGR